MSSGDPNGPGPDRDDATDKDPRGHEGAPPPPLDAPVESAPADPALGSDPTADRAPLPAAGAPAELTSDDDRPGQSPDGAAEVTKPRAPRDGLAPGEHEASVTTTSSAAADDVPVVEEAVATERTAPEGGDTRRDEVEVPVDTSDDTPDATAPGQAEPTDPPAPADVADVRPTEATNADGSPVPPDSSALAVTTTDVADEIAARGDVAAGPNEVTAAAAPADDGPSVDVHAEPSATDAPGDVEAPSGDAGATNPPVDAPTDLPATGAAAAPGEPEQAATAAPTGATEVAEPEPPATEEPGPVSVEAAAAEPEPVVEVAEPGAEAGSADEPSSVSGEATPATPAEPEPEPEPAIVDEERQPLLDLLAQHLGDGLVATHVVPGRDMTIRVTREAWVQAAEVCRDVLGMRYFGFLSAMDWMPSPYGRSEDGGLAGAGADEAFVAPDPSAFEPGTTGGETRFQLLARLEVPAAPTIGITLKCDVPSDDLVMPTWVKVFPGADWHERECAEMFGIGFAGHPNLVKLYLPGAFEGFPLRKDFPLLARDVKPWPGLVDVEAMPGEEATDDEGSVTAGAEEG